MGINLGLKGFLAILFAIELFIFSFRVYKIIQTVQQNPSIETVSWGLTTLIYYFLNSLHVDWLFYGIGGIIAFIIYYLLQSWSTKNRY